MKSVVVRVLIAFIIVVALGEVPTANAGAPLPLKPGRYVLEGVPCDRGTTGDRLYYYGGSENDYYLGLPHGEGKITQARNNGNVYHLTLQCTYKGVDGIVTEDMTISVKSPTSFTIMDYSLRREPSIKGRLFRWCDD